MRPNGVCFSQLGLECNELLITTNRGVSMEPGRDDVHADALGEQLHWHFRDTHRAPLLAELRA
jgi:hypothetical protein